MIAHGRITFACRTRRSSRSAPSSMPASRQSGLKSIRAGCERIVQQLQNLEVGDECRSSVAAEIQVRSLLGLQVGDIISS